MSETENSWITDKDSSGPTSSQTEWPQSGRCSPPTDFVINFRKCLDLFGVKCDSGRYSRLRRHRSSVGRQTGMDDWPSLLDNYQQKPIKGLSSVAEVGEGDVPKKADQKVIVDPKMNCVECGKTYSKSQYVRDHIRTVHLQSKDNYSCRVCGQAFSWKVSALKHIKRCHPEKDTVHMIDILY